MASKTLTNTGIRRNFKTLGDRNFENDSSVLYYCGREPLMFLGTLYHVGQALPYDVAGTSYSKAAIHELVVAWENGWIYPTV